MSFRRTRPNSCCGFSGNVFSGNYPKPKDYPIHGIDVSKFQGDIDWNAVANSGVKFAWLKATEGGDRADARIVLDRRILFEDLDLLERRAAPIDEVIWHHGGCRPPWPPPNSPGSALKKRGVPVGYLLFDAEQHGFRRAENIRRALDLRDAGPALRPPVLMLSFGAQ